MFRHSILALSLILGFVAQLRGDTPAGRERKWRDAEGKAHKPLANEQQRATVIVFVMHDCPVTNSSAPELNRLVEDFERRGVRFYRIYSGETAAEIRKHGSEFGLKFPGLRDPTMSLARITGATRAPEAAVISPTGDLLYRGRIDDRAVMPGRTRPVASRRDLRLAIEAVLAGKSPEARFTPAVGCYLPVEGEGKSTAETRRNRS